MSEWWWFKDSVYFVLAALFFLLFAFGMGVGLSYQFGFPYRDPTVLPLFTAFCVPIALIPGLLLAAFGWLARRNEAQLVEFAAWVKAYRRVGIGELAQKLGKSPFETEKVLVAVLDKGLVRGVIDRQTNEFVLLDAIGGQQFVQTCPKCGGSLMRWYLPGETLRCPYCQTVIGGVTAKA